MNINNAVDEYRYFIQTYLLPLLGMPNINNIVRHTEERAEDSLVYVKDGYLYFCNNKNTMFKLRYEREISEDNIRLSRNILRSFFRVSKFRMDVEKSSVNNNYYSNVLRDSVYKMAVQKGISNWIVGKDNESVEKLFDILEKWSVQTYEGRQVTLGFVINPEAESKFDNSYGNWFDFLNDDFSAVFTDCINTVIELDSNCNFCRYISLTENDKVDAYELTYESSYRFAPLMKKCCDGKKVGVFLLNNGDIILSKNAAIKFVKRNRKWLNFSYEAFKNSFGEFIDKNEVEESVLQAVFASMLDVSFSHTGGIVSLVTNVEQLVYPNTESKEVILNACDYLQSKKIDSEIVEDLALNHSVKQEEARKRMLKRKVIEAFVDNKNFVDLDRKLRSELISLDGACIIDTKGNVCACGAIIKNDSGSTGGGRGAASKKLSEYGFSIKISTDGYIELYINKILKYAIK